MYLRITMGSSKSQRKKSKVSFFSSVLSVSLILFVLGLLITMLVQLEKLTRNIKEDLVVQVLLNDDVSDSDKNQLKNTLELESYVKKIEQVSKEEAAEKMKEDLGEDFLSTIGFNPLPDAMLLYLNAQYASSDSMVWIKDQLLAIDGIEQVNYDSKLLENISNFSFKLISGLLVLFVILLVIVIIIIDNTVKLDMYSKRFLVRSMQLVGATSSFIVTPFIGRAFVNGFISTIIASVMLLTSMYFFEKYVVNVNVFGNLLDFGLIFVTLLFFGVIISCTSTYLAVRKYLRMKLDDLY